MLGKDEARGIRREDIREEKPAIDKERGGIHGQGGQSQWTLGSQLVEDRQREFSLPLPSTRGLHQQSRNSAVAQAFSIVLAEEQGERRGEEKRTTADYGGAEKESLGMGMVLR